MAEPPRRTRAFLFADLRGYTAYVESYGDRAAAELLGAYRSLVRETVARFGGAEIKTEGDSFYIVFDSASAAVECGLALVNAATAATTEYPDRPIRVGVGVHAGETVETQEGYVGSAVNVAARVCSVARPGELAVTDTVMGLVRTGLGVHFVSRGRPRLKGVAQPIEIFVVRPGAPPEAGTVRRLTRRAAPGSGLLAAAVAVAVAASLGGVVLLARGPAPSAPPAGTGAAEGSQPPGAAAPATLAGLIAFSRASFVEGGENGIFVVNPDGTGQAQLVEGGAQPSWSPDGRRIAFARHGEERVWVMNRDGSGARALASLPGASVGQSAWSPSGDRLVVVGARHESVTTGDTTTSFVANESLWIVPLDGSAIEQITSNLDKFDSFPWWSGDGRTIRFTRAGHENGIDGQVLEYDLQSKQIRELTPADFGGQASWSPDGTRAYMVRAEGARGDVFTTTGDVARVTNLTVHPADDSMPAVSPDGEMLVWVSDRDFAPGLYLMNADGRNTRPLLAPPQDGFDTEPDWGPDP